MASTIGLSALRAASEAIDATSNNIANAQTIGYKAGQYVFQDEFFKATDPQNPSRTGMGVTASHIRRSQSNGTIIATSNPLDLAIGGLGMFTTAKTIDNTATGNPTQIQYTRNGQFGVDSSSRIVNENGNYLIGRPANPDGSIREDVNSILTLDQSPLPGSQTTATKLELNLDNTTDPKSSTFDPDNSATYSQSTSQTVYDSTGQAHTLSMFYVKDDSIPLIISPGTQAISGDAKTFTGTYNFNTQQSTIGADGTSSSPITIATTSSPNTAQGGTSVQTLSNSTVKLISGTTYNMTLSDGSTLTAIGKTFDTLSNYTVPASVLTANGITPTQTGSSTTFTIPVSGGTLTMTADSATSPSYFTISSTATNISVSSGSQSAGQNFTLAVGSSGGTTIPVTGDNEPLTYHIPTSRFAVFATLDGLPVPGNSSGAAAGFPTGITASTGQITSLGTMAFIGGRNIDSIARDDYDQPQFKSFFEITAAVGGTTNPNTLSFQMDSTNMTAYSSVGQTYSNSQDGAPLSQLSSYSFDSNGKLIAQYANGQSKVQGQVLLSYFGNDSGLIPIGGNSFEESADSGTPTQGVAGSGLFGELKSQSLEQSNVDLTSQLVTLMSLQRQYSAASQVVKVASALQDDVLQRLS
jgi:flagellar hook protein FlgE